MITFFQRCLLAWRIFIGFLRFIGAERGIPSSIGIALEGIGWGTVPRFRYVGDNDISDQDEYALSVTHHPYV